MTRFGPFRLLLFPVALLAQSGATVEGTVSDRFTHAVLPEVAVVLFTPKGVNYNATTDASGTFRIPDVQAGEYRLRYQKSRFQTLEKPHPDEAPLRVGTGGSYRLDGELSRLGTIRGRVLDPDGKPLPGMQVVARFNSVNTDSEGRFALGSLVPGMYTLRGIVPSVPPFSDRLPRTQLIDTYFPSAADEADAELITLRGGPDLEGLDIHLRQSPVFRIAGMVLDQKGKPAAGASVRLLRPSKGTLLDGIMAWAGARNYLNIPGPESGEQTVTTDSSGHFEFPAVPPGEWLLQAGPWQLPDSGNQRVSVTTRRLPARVVDRDLGNIELRFEPGFPLDVKTDWRDFNPPAEVGLGPVQLFSADGGMPPIAGSAPVGSRSLRDMVHTNGDTHFENVQPGPYRIVPGLAGPAGFYAAAVLVDGHDASGQDVELTPSSAVNIVYKPNPGSIQGIVANGEGARVLLWQKATGIPYTVPTVVAGAHGQFEFHNLAPGTYTVIAFDEIDPGVAPDYLLGVIAKAPQVRVEELGTASVNVPLTHWPY